MAAREESTVREAFKCLRRTMHLHSEALRIDIDEGNDLAVMREQILAPMQGSTRQGVELAIRVLYRIAREFLGEGWSPMAVCFTHGPPRDLDRAMPRADPQSLRTIEQYLQAVAKRQPTQSERTTRLILSLLPNGIWAIRSS